MEKLLSIRDAADLMNVKEETVRQWLRYGKLEGLKAGRVWRVKPSSVENFLGILPEERIDQEELNMFFKDDNHRFLYINMLANVPSTGFKHNLTCYVLAAVGNNKVMKYMNNGIDIEAMKEELDLTFEEDALLQIAGSLYSGLKCDMSVFARLDQDNLLVVIEAIKNRYIN